MSLYRTFLRRLRSSSTVLCSLCRSFIPAKPRSHNRFPESSKYWNRPYPRPYIRPETRVESLIRAGDLDAASIVARHFVILKHYNANTCNDIIAAMCDAKRYHDAVALIHFFFKMSHIDPNIGSYNHLITIHCNEGRVDAALNVFRCFLKNLPDGNSIIVTYRLLTKGLIDAGRIDEV